MEISSTGRIVSLNVSRGGVPKRPIPQGFVTVDGLEGDRQRNRLFHGGPRRALSLYSAELIEALRREGHPIEPGFVGENVTVAGLDWSLMRPGARLRLGEVEIEITSFVVPCKTIRHAFLDEAFSRIAEKTNPGWSRVYSRVTREGIVRVGDAVQTIGSRS
jgi:MOSC domain-containing protein YiiM